MITEWDILNRLSIRPDETMPLRDLKERCGHLPSGTLVTLMKEFNLYKWEEIGMVVDESRFLDYVTADGEEGTMRGEEAAKLPTPLVDKFMFANQMEVTKSGKKIWWRIYSLGTVAAGTTLMLLGHMVFPWYEGGATLDRYIQVWQPVVPSKVGTRHGPFAWNFFTGNCDLKVRGNLGHKPLVWNSDGNSGLCMEVASKTELKFDQPLEVKKAIAKLSGDE